MTLEEVRTQLSEIKKKGFVRTLRKGPTGIGKTLESLLGIPENNFSAPDLGRIELKAHRESNTSMITLFTFNEYAWRMDELDAIRTYGKADKNGRYGLYYTMNLKPNKAGLYLCVGQSSVVVRSVDGSVIAEWQLCEIAKRFNEKVKNLLLVRAKVEKQQDGVEHFWYFRAWFYSGESTESKLKDQFKSGQIRLDLRLHDQVTMARNHGTGFRVPRKEMENVYHIAQELEF